MAAANGRRAQVLSHLGIFEPEHQRRLHAESLDTAARLCKNDGDRTRLREGYQSFEVRPDIAQLLQQAERAAANEDDRWILAAARRFLRVRPEPTPMPPPDPEVEKMIREQAGRGATADAAAEATQRAYVAGLVQLRKADPKADATAALRVQVAALRQDYEEARDRAERERGRLQALLNLRAERAWRLRLAEAVKR